MRAKTIGYRLARSLCNHLPTSSAFWLAEQLADLQWRMSAIDRRAVQANLSLVTGRPIDEHGPSVREVFRNFGRYLVEFFSLHRLGDLPVQVEGSEHLRQAQRGGRGVLIMTGHLGNWELGAVAIRRMGFPVSAVALPHDDPAMDQLFNGQRRRCGIEVIPLGRQAARQSLNSLRQGRFLGVLGDREFAQQGVSLELFGRCMTLPSGPAVLSLRSRVAVVPAFLIREGLWRFRLYVESPIWPEPFAGRADAVRSLTRAYGEVIARYVQRFPEQWLVFQPAAA